MHLTECQEIETEQLVMREKNSNETFFKRKSLQYIIGSIYRHNKQNPIAVLLKALTQTSCGHQTPTERKSVGDGE